MFSRVTKGHISIPYPHKFKLLLLFIYTFYGFPSVLDSIAATAHSNFISGITLPIQIQTLLLLLYVSNRLIFSFRKIFIAWEAVSSLAENFTFTMLYLDPLHPKVSCSLLYLIIPLYLPRSLSRCGLWQPLVWGISLSCYFSLQLFSQELPALKLLPHLVQIFQFL